eukprot:TRINITY_DN782130_c0_g1_i1.p1 TRINITY_DN782130_c0_g1~~TRINITY_DN782130_c0_g1_i1.p1  ORF type:complete len:125 (+),score=15.37 TRINITY_DN782130_c0_g1_i1:68-442(+)
MEMEKEIQASVQIRPSFRDKFPVSAVKGIMSAIMKKKLYKQEYGSEDATRWTKEISDEIRDGVKELELKRYKICVNVVVGEQRGQAIQVGCRCFWDEEADNLATEKFVSDKLFCVATCYGVYYY